MTEVTTSFDQHKIHEEEQGKKISQQLLIHLKQLLLLYNACSGSLKTINSFELIFKAVILQECFLHARSALKYLQCEEMDIDDWGTQETNLGI